MEMNISANRRSPEIGAPGAIPFCFALSRDSAAVNKNVAVQARVLLKYICQAVEIYLCLGIILFEIRQSVGDAINVFSITSCRPAELNLQLEY